MSIRFDSVDHEYLAHRRDGVILGSAFAFLQPDKLLTQNMRWLRRLIAVPEKQGVIVPIVGARAVELPGATVSSESMPALTLRSLTSDKVLYQSDRNSVHILVWDPMYANRSRVLVVRHNDQEQQRRTVRVGAQGEAELILKDLSTGRYAVHFDDEMNRDRHCCFTVAEYKLAPLVADMVAQQKAPGDILQVTIKLESFGVSVQGDVKVQLMDGDKCIHTSTVRCKDGTLRADLNLIGRGPHQIQLQLASDASKTASVAIIGSREFEREETLFSPLGIEINGSLLAGAGAQEVRGLFLTEGAVRSTPIAAKPVKDGKLQIEIRAQMESFTAAVIDPHHPRPAANAIDPDSVQTLQSDTRYVQAEKLFIDGEIAQSLAAFEECSDSSEVTHPNYEYFKACCHARLGHPEQAMQCLRNAIINGWRNYEHMSQDDDLKALRGMEAFTTLCNGGIREVKFGDVKEGDVVSVDVFAPACIVALAGYTKSSPWESWPWEGWTCALTPDRMEGVADLEKKCTPGKEARIAIKNVSAKASVYCVVKDARLVSQDTPASRLAGAIKQYAADSQQQLAVGTQSRTLFEATAPTRGASGRTQFFDSGGSMPIPAPLQAGGWEVQGTWGSAPAGFALGASADSLPSIPPQPAGWGAPAESVRRPSAMRMLAQSSSFKAGYVSAQAVPAAPPQAQPQPSAPPTALLENEPGPEFVATSQPEVLFAGFVPVRDGVAEQVLQMPDVFSDYLLEAFVTADGDWQYIKYSFRAEKSNFVDLNLPRFATISDHAQGRVYARAELGEPIVRVWRNGEQLTLGDGTADGGTISQSFAATPGDYRAELIAADGSVLDWQQKSVDEPGKIKHKVKALRLLTAGEALNLSEDADLITGLPSLKNSFTAVVEATADYSHCCCEQTAAKVLSACAMYLFADGSDDGRKRKAESIIIAGIERERTMWIKGQGLRAYPGQPLSPHYGPAAAQHLWHLSSLKSFGKSNRISRELAKAVEEGLEIAKDVSDAYKMEWPPANLRTCEDAYMLVRAREGEGNIEPALEFVRKAVAPLDLDHIDATKGLDKKSLERFGPYAAVQMRQQAAYAAAVLLHSKVGTELAKALKLADFVTKQFNQEGRLYSTVDSAAAIALLSEMKRCNVGCNGKVVVNGVTMQAADFDATMAIESIRVLEGVVALQVTHTVIEDWSKFSANIEIAVALKKDGNTQRSFNLCDSIDLHVSIPGGYKEGDLLWVCLPESLSRLTGGGQVKMFSLDFAGQNQLTISLAATGLTVGGDGTKHEQKIAVCLRNMFEEERSANPGLIPITVC